MSTLFSIGLKIVQGLCILVLAFFSCVGFAYTMKHLEGTNHKCSCGDECHSKFKCGLIS